MAKRRKRRGGRKARRATAATRKTRRGGAQRARFTKAAKACWVQLRAGELPKKGDFRACMKEGLR